MRRNRFWVFPTLAPPLCWRAEMHPVGSKLFPILASMLVMMLLVTTGCSRLGTPFSRERSLMTPSQVQRHVMPNGLTVYVVESDQVPLVTLDMWVRVGSSDEPEAIAGISHFLEHMLFKGTPRLGVGVYDKRIEEIGGYLNAATSGDYTHYYMTIPSAQLDRALQDMADVLVNSSIDAGEVEKERLVILEEIRMKNDQPIGFLYDEITRRVYDSGPYENTVIGSSETVSAITRDQLLDHYHRFYAPENMAFLVVGDVRASEILPLVEKELGTFQRALKPHRNVEPITRFSAPVQETWNRDWQETYFFFTLPGHELDSLERIAVDSVVEQVLGGGRSSRLVKTLREEKAIVTSISFFGPSYRYPAFWGIYGTCQPDQVNLVRQEVEKVLEEAANNLTLEELNRAKKAILTQQAFQTETNAGKAGTLGLSFALLGNAELLTDYPAAVESVTLDQVRKSLGELSTQPVSTFVVTPEVIGPGTLN